MPLPIPALETEKAQSADSASAPPAASVKSATAGTRWRTLRTLRWSQLGYLVMRRVLPRSKSPAKLQGPITLRAMPGAWPFLEWQPEASRQMIATCEFSFLNQTVASKGSIPWNDRRHAKLWLYHLNYFDFLNVDFRLPEEEPLLQAAFEIMLDWRGQNALGTEVGWEPYALSLRIVNWLKFLARHKHALERMESGERVKRLIESAGVQAATLERRLEKDLLGNHFLKNIKALLFAGAMLESPRSRCWWAKGETLIEQQLHEQILRDGGHFERSPMYHAQILEDLAEIRLLCRGSGKKLACAELLSQKIQSMAHFLKGILHPDGEIPLFNDSVLGGGRLPAELLTLAEATVAKTGAGEPQVKVFPDTGYGIIRSPESHSTLIFDCGPLGPDYQPGHGHCDVLSYELSLHGQRVVVDTGVSTYEPGPERLFERSTAAHNTLRIDDEEQAEIWASFRVGRKPRVGKITGGRKGVFSFVRGQHDAYRRLGVVHAREILLCSPDTWIVVDLLSGSGSHRVESCLHFHPKVRVEALNRESSPGLPVRRWMLEFAGQTYLLATYGDAQVNFLKSWYSEQFGNRQPSTALRWVWQRALPTGMIYVFAPVGASVPHISADWSGNFIEIGDTKILLGSQQGPAR